jgi:N-hydroxyarylamine O-acetyltransferase
MSDIEIGYNIDDAPMTDDEIKGYLKSIGIECDINTDLNRLALLQNAHLTHIPYENYDSLE